MTSEPKVNPSVDHIQDFIFSRELAEVYLLLDNVSTSSTKSLPPPPPKTEETASPDLVSEICSIAWPPKGSAAQQAAQAATLVRARDLLNRLAAPATGATIAFTLLVAGEDTTSDIERRRPGRFLKSLWRLLGIGQKRSPATSKAVPPENPARTSPPTHERSSSLAPSRFSLASRAFPNLVKRARFFRLFVPSLVAGLLLVFVGTSVLSWDIAAGNAALAQWTKARIAPSKTPAIPGGGGTAVAPEVQQSTPDLAIASANLSHWLSAWDWLQFPREIRCPGKCKEASEINAQWAEILLNILGGAVLPICYGLLGAGATVVRQISARIKESLLAPRHMMLAGVQLTLGAMISGCIGLFVTPSGAGGSTGPGLFGSVQLSASALCFIAGFGVDGVFLALEGLIRRVFNVPDLAKPNP